MLLDCRQDLYGDIAGVDKLAGKKLAWDNGDSPHFVNIRLFGETLSINTLIRKSFSGVKLIWIVNTQKAGKFSEKEGVEHACQ